MVGYIGTMAFLKEMTKHPLENYVKTGCLGFQVGIWGRFEPILMDSLYIGSFMGGELFTTQQIPHLCIYIYTIIYIIYIELAESFDSLP